MGKGSRGDTEGKGKFREGFARSREAAKGGRGREVVVGRDGKGSRGDAEKDGGLGVGNQPAFIRAFAASREILFIQGRVRAKPRRRDRPWVGRGVGSRGLPCAALNLGAGGGTLGALQGPHTNCTTRN